MALKTLTFNNLIDALRRDSPPVHKLLTYLTENPQIGSKPPVMIRGTWYYVDPFGGANVNNGLTPTTAFSDLLTAYTQCVDGVGDGIVLLSAGTTSANTTSYLKQPLLWTKSGITVVGIEAPTRTFGRARIANKDVVTSANVTMVDGVHTFTRSDAAGSFITDGWVVGMTGTNVDSGANNGLTFTVTIVTDTVMTFIETFTAQTAGQTVSAVLTSYCTKLIDVQGANNAFYNVHVGNFGVNVLSVGCVKTSGSRNAFVRCHFIGAGSALPAAATGANDLELVGDENTFESCTIGDDTINRAAANGNILLSGSSSGPVAVWRNRFYDCDIFSYSATAGKGAIKSGAATGCNGFLIFARCRFFNWTPNGLTLLTSAFIGTKLTSGQLLMDGCSLVGWSAWDSVSANKNVYVANSNATASGAGGIATAP